MPTRRGEKGNEGVRESSERGEMVWCDIWSRLKKHPQKVCVLFSVIPM